MTSKPEKPTAAAKSAPLTIFQTVIATPDSVGKKIFVWSSSDMRTWVPGSSISRSICGMSLKILTNTSRVSRSRPKRQSGRSRKITTSRW